MNELPKEFSQEKSTHKDSWKASSIGHIPLLCFVTPMTKHNKGMTGPIGYCQVDDIQKSLQVLLDAGAQTQQEVTDVGGGMLTAWVKDADNNLIGLRQFP